MEEVRREEKKGRYGSMEPLSREDFVKEVTEGSRINGDTGLPEVEEDDDDNHEEGGGAVRRGLKGTGVVVFLYKDS